MERFDANSYLAIMRMIDTWDPMRGKTAQAAYGGIRAKLKIVGISSDLLFPESTVRRFADDIRSAGVEAEYRVMVSDHGHDAFLAEQTELVRLIQ